MRAGGSNDADPRLQETWATLLIVGYVQQGRSPPPSELPVGETRVRGGGGGCQGWRSCCGGYWGFVYYWQLGLVGLVSLAITGVSRAVPLARHGLGRCVKAGGGRVMCAR